MSSIIVFAVIKRAVWVCELVQSISFRNMDWREKEQSTCSKN
jgi:hypothetical protein